ncbi:MAG: DUF933 domain-containing protein [Elusimicrobiota bacterium]|nr:DUF933 domain-containing protein [Elusimicrobiota bacterium]
MKIGFTAIELPEGKIKYSDEKLIALEKKCEPDKVSPFFVEFIRDEFVQADSIVIPKEKILDLLIIDIEKYEARMQNAGDTDEKEFLVKCITYLEKEIPLYEVEFNENEQKYLRTMSPLSMKPVAVIDGILETNELIKKVLEKSRIIFFYTAGKDDVHAWPVNAGSDIVTCAGKIHTDLARGFIKADIVRFEDFMKCHNMNDAKSKGFVKLVDRDYIVKDGDIIEIRFNI